VLNNVVDQVVFPTTPSPFVTVAVKGKRTDAHEVWDLRTMKRVGVVDPEDPFSRASLSPDGAWFAVPTFGIPASPGADVYAAADGHRYRIAVSNDQNRSCDNIDFAGPGQAVTLIYGPDKIGGAAALVQVWDIKTRKEVRRIDAAAPLDRTLRAFSPGRRYLALPSTRYDRVLLYDLTSTELAGELPLPAGAKTLGLSFSPDGKSLAGLFQVSDTKRLLAWNLDAATGSAHFTLGPEAVPNVTVYQGPVLDWMPDGGGWVVYGRRIIDAQSGAYYWPIPAKDSDWTPRHIFPDSRLAYVKDDRGKRFLAIEPQQKDKMEEALKRVRGGR
jgi:WD40 repeat protein